MKKYISIILSSILLLSGVSVNAEGEDYTEIEDAAMSIDIVENEATNNNDINNAEAVESADETLKIIETETEIETEIEEQEEIDMPALLGADSNPADEWSAVAGMNEQRAHCEPVTLDGDLYVVGGIGSDGYLDTIERYDASTDSWQIITSIPGAPKGFGVAGADSKIYIIGGYSDSGYLNNIQIYDVDNDEWSTMPSMNEKRDQPAVLYMDSKLYVFGGRNLDGFVNSYEYYDFSDSTWNEVTTGFSDSMIRVGAHAQYIDGYVCIYGGIDSSYSYGDVSMYSADNLRISQGVISCGYDGVSIAWGTNKALIFAWSRANSSYNVHELTVDNGEVQLSNVVFADVGSADKYSQYIINDGYLYVLGGYNLTSHNYINTVKKYSVYYGDYSIGDGTINNSVTSDGNSITLNVEAGREYMLFVNTKHMSSIAGYTFALEYPESSFTIEDGCALTAEKNKNTGLVNNANIEITNLSNEGIEFRCTESLPEGVAVTKSINAIILKANSSGQRTITYSMIHE